jgi:hypothetical protein
MSHLLAHCRESWRQSPNLSLTPTLTVTHYTVSWRTATEKPCWNRLKAWSDFTKRAPLVSPGQEGRRKDTSHCARTLPALAFDSEGDHTFSCNDSHFTEGKTGTIQYPRIVASL